MNMYPRRCFDRAEAQGRLKQGRHYHQQERVSFCTLRTMGRNDENEDIEWR